MNQELQERIPVIGAWKLVSFETRKENGEVVFPFGKNAQGSLIYTKSGRMSVHLMRSDRPRFASGDQMKGTTEEIKANYEGLISYYGSYEFDREKGLVIHNIQGSLFPNWEGQRQERYFELSGDRLKLSTPPTLWGGGKAVAVMLWERIE
jgi:hypothetical protein